jgi:hypothetical protein
LTKNFSPHENYREDEPVDLGSDRAFGYTVGTVLMVIGAAKSFMAGEITLVSFLIFVPGPILLLLSAVAPSRLSALNKFWVNIGAGIAKVVNPIVLAVLFFFVVTPTAYAMRLSGKRPLRLAADRSAASYWIVRGASGSRPSAMRQQF